MNQRKAKDVIDAFEKAEKISQDRPPLPKGVLPSYLKLIDWIYQLSQKRKVKISDIADILHLSRPGITRSLNAMEEIGLIEKKASLQDGRVVYVFLTEKGQHYYFQYVDQYYKKLSQRLEKYDEHKINEMIDLINQVCDDLSMCPIEMENTNE